MDRKQPLHAMSPFQNEGDTHYITLFKLMIVAFYKCKLRLWLITPMETFLQLEVPSRKLPTLLFSLNDAIIRRQNPRNTFEFGDTL